MIFKGGVGGGEAVILPCPTREYKTRKRKGAVLNSSDAPELRVCYYLALLKRRTWVLNLQTLQFAVAESYLGLLLKISLLRLGTSTPKKRKRNLHGQ